MELTRKKQVVKWQTSPVGVFKLRHCGLDTFLGRLGLVSVLRIQRLGLISVLWLNVLWTSLRDSVRKVFRLVWGRTKLGQDLQGQGNQFSRSAEDELEHKVYYTAIQKDGFSCRIIMISFAMKILLLKTCTDGLKHAHGQGDRACGNVGLILTVFTHMIFRQPDSASIDFAQI